MNRHRFLQSLTAACALPAVPALAFQPAAAAAPPAATTAAARAMAGKARFWAIYMHGVQGSCTPATLSAVLGIPEVEARKHVTRLAAEGLICPNPLVRKAAAKAVDRPVKGPVKAKDGEGRLLGKVKERIEGYWADEEEDQNGIEPDDEAPARTDQPEIMAEALEYEIEQADAKLSPALRVWHRESAVKEHQAPLPLARR